VKRLLRVCSIINLKTLFVTFLVVVSTYLCLKYKFIADYPLTLIATVIYFPIVFSIEGAYKMRESALDDYGSIKAHGNAIYFATRDWLEEPYEETIQKVRNLLVQLMLFCRILFAEPVRSMRKNEDHVYKYFSELSAFIKNDLRANGLVSG
jgi:hypothetical protein